MAVRMAHIQLPEDLGIEDAILPGDPARVDRVAALLEQPEELMFNREYKSVRGLWKGRPVLIISTGMGGPSTAIAVEELATVLAGIDLGHRMVYLTDAVAGVTPESEAQAEAIVSYLTVPHTEVLTTGAYLEQSR